MTQDFAKTGTQTRKKKKRSVTKRSRPVQQSNVPAWVWVFTGVLTGAFIMFLIYLSGLAPDALKTSQGASTSSTVTQEELKEKAKPVFEFYDRLMNSEVVVDISEEAEPEDAVIYILQAASFQKYEEADALKAKLILAGLDVEIQEFNNKGEIWHRVLVGPFDSRSKMAKARSTLAQHDISPITLKRAPDG